MTPYASGKRWTLYHGDALDIAPVAGVDAAVMLTDPPFGIDYRTGAVRVEGNPRSIAGDLDTAARDAILKWWAPRPALVFGSRKRDEPAGTRMTLIWDQGAALGMGALDLPWKPSWQEVYVIGAGFHGHRGGGVLQHPPVQAMATMGRVHPNEKPVGLLRALLVKCPAGGVFDPFAGSGSTGVAALLEGRSFVGIELDPAHVDGAARRLAQAESDGVQHDLFSTHLMRSA